MKRVAIVGTGLIGGSLGLALTARHKGLTIKGFDRDPTALERALEIGAVTHAAGSLEECVSEAEIVVLTVPVDGMGACFASLAGLVDERCLVTDSASTKQGVVAGGEASVGKAFVGGHPMSGSERHGIEAASEDLFEDAWWILTPTPRTSSAAYKAIAAFVTGVGAKPVAVAPDVHDALVARLSHLPQIAASSLVDVAANSGDRAALLGLAAGGFRDVTRIAASDPALWVSILRSNAPAILEALDALQGRLGEVGEILAGERWEELERFLGGARSSRLRLFTKPVHTGEPVSLALLVPDRPGVLAEVTTAAGEMGANIEDLNIFHSTEGGRGRLEIVVAGREAAGRMVAKLTELGYHVDLGAPE